MEYEQYVRERHRSLLRFATTVTGDPRLAEDIVQDVLTRAFARWSTIAELDRPHAYVRRMVVNEHLSWRRRWGRIEPRADVQPERSEPDGAEPRAERDALVAEIVRLPRRQRVVLALRYFEDVPDPEIAQILDCSTATVRSIAARALGRLRVRLTDADPDSEADSHPGPAARRATPTQEAVR